MAVELLQAAPLTLTQIAHLYSTHRAGSLSHLLHDHLERAPRSCERKPNGSKALINRTTTSQRDLNSR